MVLKGRKTEGTQRLKIPSHLLFFFRPLTPFHHFTYSHPEFCEQPLL